MHPILFEIPRIDLGAWTIGPVPIRLYGLMIGIGFLLAITLASRRAKKQGINPELIMDMGVYLLLAAIIGSRLLYVLTTFQEFKANPLDIFAIWKGGLVFYGGLLAAVPVGIWYVSRHNLPVWKTADIMAPSIALAHGFGRLGCFFAGCCYGSPCSGPLCITFTDIHSLAPVNVSLFPTQLMESGGEFAIFGLLLFLSRSKRFDGQIFGLYLVFYAILRFILEFFRGDVARGVYFGGMISTSQIIAILIVIAASAALAIGWRTKPTQPTPVTGEKNKSQISNPK